MKNVKPCYLKILCAFFAFLVQWGVSTPANASTVSALKASLSLEILVDAGIDFTASVVNDGQFPDSTYSLVSPSSGGGTASADGFVTVRSDRFIQASMASGVSLTGALADIADQYGISVVTTEFGFHLANGSQLPSSAWITLGWAYDASTLLGGFVGENAFSQFSLEIQRGNDIWETVESITLSNLSEASPSGLQYYFEVPLDADELKFVSARSWAVSAIAIPQAAATVSEPSVLLLVLGPVWWTFRRRAVRNVPGTPSRLRPA